MTPNPEHHTPTRAVFCRLIAHCPERSIDVIMYLTFRDLAQGLLRMIDKVSESSEVRIISSICVRCMMSKLVRCVRHRDINRRTLKDRQYLARPVLSRQTPVCLGRTQCEAFFHDHCNDIVSCCTFVLRKWAPAHRAFRRLKRRQLDQHGCHVRLQRRPILCPYRP